MKNIALALSIDSLTQAKEDLKQATETWRCFHCGFATSDPLEAEAHFGARDDEGPALCKFDDDELRKQHQEMFIELQRSRATEEQLLEELERLRSNL